RANGADAEFPAKRNYGDKVRSRQVSAQREDEVFDTEGEVVSQNERRPQRPVGGNRAGGYSPGGSYGQRPRRDEQRPQRPQRRFVQATQSDDAVAPQDEFTGERRYGNRTPRGGYNQRPQPGERRPPRRDQSEEAAGSYQSQSFDTDTDFNGGRRRFNQQE